MLSSSYLCNKCICTEPGLMPNEVSPSITSALYFYTERRSNRDKRAKQISISKLSLEAPREGGHVNKRKGIQLHQKR